MKKARSYLALLVFAFLFSVCLYPNATYAATIGNALPQPESTWKRFDDTNAAFQYKGSGFYTLNDSAFYNSTTHLTTIANDYITFKFYGTKLRLISETAYNRPTNAKVTIDGKDYTYNGTMSSVKRALVFEVNGLASDLHTVKITNPAQGKYLDFDAVDIDSDGYLVSTNTPLNVKAVASDSKVTLDWSQIPDAESYKVSYGTKAGEYTQSVTIAKDSYNNAEILNLTNGTPYYFVVASVVNKQTSPFSSEVTATPIKPSAPVAPTNLTATTQKNTPVLTWDASATATSYTVSRSVYANGPFEDIAQNITDINYTDASAKAGNTYYYIVKASSQNGTSPASNIASVTLEALRSSLDVIIAPETIKVGETFTADIALKNVQDIYAEDFSLSYDPTLVQYVGYEVVSGYKVYNETKDTPGALRFIIASQGKSFVINSDTTIVRLKFKAIAAGSAKIDALKARVADTTKEYDLETANVLEDTILIEKPRFLDVDRSGQYTLLDLSLDAFYFGMKTEDTNTELHDADQTGNGQIGDADLSYIVDQILLNQEYAPNK